MYTNDIRWSDIEEHWHDVDCPMDEDVGALRVLLVMVVPSDLVLSMSQI